MGVLGLKNRITNIRNLMDGLKSSVEEDREN